MSEKQFTCSRLVAVGSTQDDLHSEVLEARASLSPTMIGSTVHYYDHLLTPLDSVHFRQTTSQLGQEQLHDVLVRIALCQSHPYLSL